MQDENKLVVSPTPVTHLLVHGGNPYKSIGKFHNIGMDSVMSKVCEDIHKDGDTSYTLENGYLPKYLYENKVLPYVTSYALNNGYSQSEVEETFEKINNVFNDVNMFTVINGVDVIEDINLKAHSLLLASYNRGYIDSLNYFLMEPIFSAISDTNWLAVDSLINNIDVENLDSILYAPSLKAIAVYDSSKAHTEVYLNRTACNMNMSKLRSFKQIPLMEKNNSIQTNWNAEWFVAIGGADLLGAAVGGGIGGIVTSSVVVISRGLSEGWFDEDTGHCCCGANCGC